MANVCVSEKEIAEFIHINNIPFCTKKIFLQLDNVIEGTILSIMDKNKNNGKNE
jgi:hypothetical protein